MTWLQKSCFLYVGRHFTSISDNFFKESKPTEEREQCVEHSVDLFGPLRAAISGISFCFWTNIF